MKEHIVTAEDLKNNPGEDLKVGETIGIPELSLGEKRVRTEFNPSKEGIIDQIKQKSAHLIDICEEIRIMLKPNGVDFYTNDKEAQRCLSLAQTAYEEAAMWAVKAATS